MVHIRNAVGDCAHGATVHHVRSLSVQGHMQAACVNVTHGRHCVAGACLCSVHKTCAAAAEHTSQPLYRPDMGSLSMPLQCRLKDALTCSSSARNCAWGLCKAMNKELCLQCHG